LRVWQLSCCCCLSRLPLLLQLLLHCLMMLQALVQPLQTQQGSNSGRNVYVAGIG
jgi:hypothetical protein